jgi:hypothetical protein
MRNWNTGILEYWNREGGHSPFRSSITPICQSASSFRPWIFLVGYWLFTCIFANPALAAEETAEAVVTLSDGTVTSGTLSMIGSRPLTLVPFGRDRQRMFLFSDIAAIAHEVEKASMERPWTFKESGKAEKIYLDGHYPLLNFKTLITLINGSVVTGHVISAVMTLKGPETQQKVFFQRQIKGTLEQTLADIVYVSGIRMTARALAGGGVIKGRVDGFGKVSSVTALDNAREQILAAKVTQDNQFDFGAVLPGTYDLCVLTDTHVLTGHSGDTPRSITGDILQDGDLAAINQKFPLADDFFNDRWILRLQGHRGFAKALIYKRRADYYEAEKWTPGGFLWHLEVWSWHFADPDWKVDRRYILIRHKQKGGEQDRRLMYGKRLDAVTPGSTLDIHAGAGNDEEWHFIRDLK